MILTERSAFILEPQEGPESAAAEGVPEHLFSVSAEVLAARTRGRSIVRLEPIGDDHTVTYGSAVPVPDATARRAPQATGLAAAIIAAV